MGKEAQCTQSVIYSYNDDPFLCEILTVEFHLGGISPLESAAEEPYENGKLVVFALCIGPYVQIEAVLTDLDILIDMPLFAVDISSDTGLVLNRDGSKFISIVNAFPILAGLRCLPAVFSYRRFCKGDTLKCSDAGVVSGKTSYKSVLGPDCFQHAEYLM